MTFSLMERADPKKTYPPRLTAAARRDRKAARRARSAGGRAAAAREGATGVTATRVRAKR